MRRLSWIISLPLLIVGVVFAVANRQAVELSLWPFDIRLEAPLFLLVLLSLFVGFLAGGAGVWFAAGHKRRSARAEHRRIRDLEREVRSLKSAQSSSSEALVKPGS